MPDYGTTVDPFIVNGVRTGGGGGFGGALGGVGALLGGALGGSFNAAPTLADYYKGNPSALSDAINRMFPQTPTPATNSAPPAASQAPSNATTVSPVDVVGTPGGVPGTGVGTAALAAGAGLAGLGALAGGSSAPGGAQSVPAGTDASSLPATEVSPVTVTPTVASSAGLSPLTLTALGAGLGGLAAGQTPSGATPNGSLPSTANSDDPSTWTPLETAIAAGAGGAGLGTLAAGQSPFMGTANSPPPPQQGFPGFDPSKLLPLLPLLPLLGGGGGGPGGPTDALTDLAKNNVDLSNRLGSIATAGFAGDIGGRGLNSIARMVRNAQAAIRQRYAGMGMSGSTAEQDDLNAASQAGVDQQFKIGQQMAQTGLAAIAALTGQSAAIYTSLLNAATAKDTALGNALSNFAAAVTH